MRHVIFGLKPNVVIPAVDGFMQSCLRNLSVLLVYGSHDGFMRHIATIMTAAPRIENVQSRCISSTLASGFSPLTIFAEPDTIFDEWVVDHPAITVIKRRHRFGEWQNWTHAMLDAVNQDSQIDAIVSLQDDILFCRNVRQLVEHLMWPSDRCGIVHLYTSRRYGGIIPSGKCTQLRSDLVCKMAGACALAFRPEAAADISEWGVSNGWRGATSGVKTIPCEKEGLDTFIGEAAAELGWEVWICNPSLALHIGEESTLGHGGSLGGRQGASWPGAEANALEVIR